ncbi:MAG: type II TA system antitoxin MqsA family protein [Senegalia sp. (in: firmicutes)]
MDINKRVYCSNCDNNVNYSIRKGVIENYKGYKVDVEEKIAVCNVCNNDIYVSEIESENFKRLYSKYKELADIISGEEIISFRNDYNISQRELTSILNWGKMTINRYERGAVPSQSYNDLLKLIISNQDIFKEKVEDAFQCERITQKTYDKVQDKLKKSSKDYFKEVITDSLTHIEDEYNGYRKFDIERLMNLLSYIADNVDLYKTSMNKYLWFIDFENFKENVRSITGLRYMRFTYGPIIEDFKYEEILNFFDDKIVKEEFEEDCKITTKIKSKKNYDLSIFKKEELEVINNVINKLKEKSCTEISNLSHEEEGWIQNDNRDLISYDFADKLKLTFK